MAIEIRCPECQAKLKLPEAPDPEEELECGRCGEVFAASVALRASRPVGERRPADASGAGRKGGGTTVASQSRTAAKDGASKSSTPAGAKKRKIKKKKADPRVLIAAVGGGVLALGLMVAVLVYLLGRQPPAVALMAYLPRDANYAYGINFSQLQKYLKFYKDFEGTIADEGPDPYASLAPITDALGLKFHELVDYAIGAGSFNWDTRDVLVLKTKAPIDRGKLAALGSKAEAFGEAMAYSVPKNAAARGGFFARYFPAKVMAPSDRILVIAPENTPSSRLQQMAQPNQGEDSFVGKAGSLGRRMARGNVWWFVFDKEFVGKKGTGDDPLAIFGFAPDDPKKGGQPSGIKARSLQGLGVRSNLRSRDVSFEVAFWLSDSDAVAEAVRTFKDSELAKRDEGAPPRHVTEMLNTIFSEKTLALQILSNLDYGSSGDLFYLRTAADTAKIQTKLGEWSGVAKR